MVLARYGWFFAATMAAFMLFAIVSSAGSEAVAHSVVIRNAPSGFYVALGNQFFKQGNPALAARLFEEAVRVGNSAAAYHNLGVIYYEDGNTGKAEEEFRSAIESYPDYAKAHNSLAIILFHRGQFAEAAVHFRDAARLEPESAQAHFDLGVSIGNNVRDGTGSAAGLAEAVEQFREAERLQPGYPHAKDNINALESILGSQ